MVNSIAEAEGTKEVSPTATSISALVLIPDRASGSYKGSALDNRIHFNIAATSERLYYGFNWQEYGTNTAVGTNMYVQFYNPNGTTAGAPVQLSNAGNGFIGSYTAAVNGPNIGGVTTGYAPLTFTPTVTGEHYMEIYRSADGGVTQVPIANANNTSRSKSPFFDFTVATTGTVVKKPGRVFCEKWGFVAINASTSVPDAAASAEPTIFSYSFDQTVVKITFRSGFRPIAYDIALNDYGVVNNGNWLVDRNSVNSANSPVLADGYKLFLNNPETALYPVPAIAGTAQLAPVPITGCAGSYQLHFTMPAAGDARLLFDLNGVSGYQEGTIDRIIEIPNATAGANTVAWDGKNGLGGNVASGATMSISAIYQRGRFNIPIYDAEINQNGFNIETIAPIPLANNRLYWNDSGLTNVGSGTCDANGGANNLTGAGLDKSVGGVVSPTHAWNGNGNTGLAIPAPAVAGNDANAFQCDDFGNVRIINSWGWALQSPSSSNTLTFGCFSVSGRVYNDVNGIKDNLVNGVGTNVSGGLHAILVDLSGNVVKTIPVNADGTYTFSDVIGYDFDVIISTTAGTPGSAAPAPAVPAGWVNTGEQLGIVSGSGIDATPNGSIRITVTGNTTNVNFGIEQRPETAVNVQPSQVNPGGTTSVTVPPTAFSTSNVGGNPNTGDPSPGAVTGIVITAFPATATSITINGTAYTNLPAITAAYPNGIPTNASGQPTVPVLVDPVDGAVNVVIPIAAIDAAGVQDNTPGSITLQFAAPVSISGNVFNDANGLTAPGSTVDGTAIQSASGSQLHANLFTAGGTFIATVAVNGSGAYTFGNLAPSTNYQVTISSTAASAGSTPAGSVALPASWVHTGENIGTGIGNDGTADGILAVSVATSSIVNANFGIEQAPETAVNLQPSQLNPGGTNSVTVPPTAFTTSNVGANANTGDPAPGTVTGIVFTAFPTSATSITINGNTYTTIGAITAAYPNGIPTNGSGQPTVPVSVDPIDGTVNVVIAIAAIDAAGIQDPTPGSITLQLAQPVTISGTVFNDVNGLTSPGSTVDGTAIQNASGSQLHANLFTSGGTFVATVPVDGSGNYSFGNLTPSTNYQVTVSTTAASAGSTPAGSAALPASWVHTGENIGTGVGSDGTPNGILAVAVAANNVTNANFGIQQAPETAVNQQPSQINPGGTNTVTVPPTAFTTSNVGGNPNTGDPAPGAVTGIIFTAFPTSATSITIDGTVYTTLPAIQAAYPNGIPTEPSGQPTVPVLIDPIDGSVSVVIAIAAVDAAGTQDPSPGSITLQFAAPVSISGTVFNDVNGLTLPGGTVDGTAIQNASGAQLYANLFDGAGNFLTSVAVNGSGAYTFSNLAPSANYQVTISSTQATAGANPGGSTGLPTSWVHVGENIGTTIGDDGTTDGILVVAVANTSIVNANFGIEQAPETAVHEQPGQLNPGGTTSVTVPATSFVTSNVGSNPNTGDPAPGAVTGLVLTAFPTNATSITINGTAYTTLEAVTAAYPNGIPTSAGGQPTVPVQIDPVDGSVTVVIAFAAIDAAGVQDATPGSITLQFAAPVSISGTVFNDANGLTPPGSKVDGTPIQTAAGTQLHANLFTNAGDFVATVPIDAAGNYVFNNLTPSANYQITIGITPASAGTTPAASIVLPTGWKHVGENIGTDVGNDGLVDGLLLVGLANSSITNANFAIERTPTADAKSGTVVTQPTPDSFVPLNGTVGGVPALTGSDPDDQPSSGGLSGKTIAITSLPTNGELWYNGAKITLGADGVNPPSPSNPFVIPNLDPALLQIRFTGSGYSSTTFTYAYVDNAGAVSPPANYTLNFAPLPVVLARFDAKREGTTALLTWETTSETNSDRFEIEHSMDGKYWAAIGSVRSKGESKTTENYRFVVENPLNGDNLYRLKMVDHDGTFAYSRVRNVKFEIGVRTKLYPNPVANVLYVELEGAVASDVTDVKLYALDGRVVYRASALPSGGIDVRGIPDGAYLVSVKLKSNVTQNAKIMVIK